MSGIPPNACVEPSAAAAAPRPLDAASTAGLAAGVVAVQTAGTFNPPTDAA
ncbi:Uncharacterised protein [Mycobacterium tuberculosis]|uniref:Uncharacterized protein n=1 Tax=Mycobacterium tuberculosis TaxID=1773 RepID=A0A655AYU1_MYCTX|nr:Uncharacterised protein [Mycobacterium tuberculosis]